MPDLGGVRGRQRVPSVEVEVELALHLLEAGFGPRVAPATRRVVALGRRNRRRRHRGRVQSALEVLVDVAVEVSAEQVEPEHVQTSHLGGNLFGNMARHVVYPYGIQFL